MPLMQAAYTQEAYTQAAYTQEAYTQEVERGLQGRPLAHLDLSRMDKVAGKGWVGTLRI
eukprot:CAMPEP_0183352890 /NCGR_PEP_ID=MMETSP0164_2-20130417/31393_1 /TAXON_ID=221442 /ORGANISM="Coccolithus pelagicus ssp braarudi, Strain PLY182g" /LENGTH=58 /DNA_ID=CAMNT_0025525455 /DNA_START=115 /DNA_END=291 /DNA_ORIENTATION=-